MSTMPAFLIRQLTTHTTAIITTAKARAIKSSLKKSAVMVGFRRMQAGQFFQGWQQREIKQRNHERRDDQPAADGVQAGHPEFVQEFYGRILELAQHLGH